MNPHTPTAPHALADVPCAGRADVFQHPHLESPHPRQRSAAEQRALAICYRCPVLHTCRQWALSVEVDGVTGGLTAAQRRAFNPALIPPPPHDTRTSALPPTTDPRPTLDPAASLDDHVITRCTCGAWTLTTTPCRTCAHLTSQASALTAPRAA